MSPPSPLLSDQLERVRRMARPGALHAVAFSGGVDSSLTAWLVHRIYGEGALACLGVSAALPAAQREQAQAVAAHIGIPLVELPTDEGGKAGYVANAGDACFFCKTSLYATLEGISSGLDARYAGRDICLYNGTNLDDRADPTRVGLKAAADFGVLSPLDNLTKAQVRQLAQEVGLPNWDHAASPCLRSRLQYEVEATPERLARVERAEATVRRFVGLRPQDNLRVRALAGEEAMIEVDATRLTEAQSALPAIRTALVAMGFVTVDLRGFRSGSLSRPAQ